MFKNLATRDKLLISFLTMIICIFIIVPVACFSLSAKGEGEEATRVANSLVQIAEDVDAAQVSMMAASAGKGDTLGDLSDLSKHLKVETDSLIQELNPEKLNQISRLVDQYQAGIKQYLQLNQSGQTAEAQKFVLGSQLDKCKSIRGICAPLSKELVMSDHSMEGTIRLIACVGLLSIIFAVFCFLNLYDEIAKPLQELTRASESLAAGNLSVELPDANRKDEIGSVIRAYESMVSSLRDLSSAAQRVAQGDLRVEVKPRSQNDSLGIAFASMIDNMSTATSQIKSAVEVLSSAVSNIMASVSDSASGATETATAVTETTTTVEEVRQTSHVANQKAKNVAESAQKSAQISTMGRKSTEETILGMKRIREQMDLIADSMVRLSEKSQSIVEIIATVDDLAQQSNLLAVNASIEAAKAGELGRGFAVVAQEVKSMSDQSKQATAQVRKILGEIQQATTSAAMATELGSRAVDAAVTQSNQAGEAISTLANSVIESANAAAQIAVSSQQQLAGVDQVATAMLGIKDATSQNLIAIKRVEDATLTLQELGGTLTILTKQYQL
jgi:methyl-accepting chemotaxis protein